MSAIQQVMLALGASGPAINQWDPAKSSSVTTFSDGNTVAISTYDAPDPVFGAEGFALSLVGKSTGKWYWEVLLGGGYTTRTVDFGYGVVNFSDPDEGFQTQNVSADPVSGDIVSVALDLTGGTVTFRINNSVVASDSVAVVPRPVYAFVRAYGGGPGQSATFTAKFKAASLTYTPPAGYSALE